MLADFSPVDRAGDLGRAGLGAAACFNVAFDLGEAASLLCAPKALDGRAASCSFRFHSTIQLVPFDFTMTRTAPPPATVEPTVGVVASVTMASMPLLAAAEGNSANV